MPTRPEPISLEQAAALAAGAVTQAPVRWVPVDAALHRISARDLVCPFPIPAEARSRMDGYAVRAQDTRGASRADPRMLRCLDQTLAAGTVPAVPLERGTACRILTGAVLPDGADAVVADEDAERSGDTIRVFAEAFPGQWISPAGEGMERGAVGVRAGTRLTAPRLAAAVAMGYAHVPVFTRCRVAVMSTGSEILEPGSAWRPGASYADTRYLLAGWLRSVGAVPIHLGCAADDPSAIAALLDKAPGPVAVTTGGTGRGDKDFVFRVWDDLGITPIFHGVAMKPGGGTALGRREGRLFWAVPGTPWAATVVFHELFLPMLETWYGSTEPFIRTYTAHLERGLTWENRGVRAVPGRLFTRENQLWFDPLPPHSSHSVFDLAEINAYALVPTGRGRLDAESPITARLLTGHGIAPQ
ncbi:MAG: molybdopterin molybdotransferase MoeA [Desulfosoma sp.]